MPMPYSHYLLAQRVAKEGKLAITDKANYYLGAFMPDIRYFTKLPRDKYHFPVNQLESFRHDEDVTPEFLLGYKVHLIIDEVWEYPEIKRAYFQAFPSIIRGRMTRGLQAVAFEMFCLQQSVEIVELKLVENSLTQALEAKAADISRAVTSMQRYLEHRNLAAALDMAKELTLFPEARLKTLQQVVMGMRNPLIHPVVHGVVASASRPVFHRVIQAVLNRLEGDAG